jgi:hypothetical protein
MTRPRAPSPPPTRASPPWTGSASTRTDISSCRPKPAGDDPADIALLAELHEEARTSRPPTPGEIAYDEAHEAISALWDALAHQERREYTDYAEQLTSAVHARPAALNLPAPVTVNITLAPEGARSDELDDHAPATHPRNAIEAAIHDTIANTPTPSALPGTPLDRLAAPQPEGS